MTEIKKSNTMFIANGSGYKLPRVAIPSRWFKEMGITEDNKEVTLTYQDGKVIIQKA